MLHELADPENLTPEELHDRYLSALVDVLADQGVDRVTDETDLDREQVEALAEGEAVELTLEAAAAILALDGDTADADTIATIARDELLMGMTTAVLDVEAVESGLGGELEAREIQSKVEGRFPMTLREFALLYSYINGKV